MKRQAIPFALFVGASALAAAQDSPACRTGTGGTLRLTGSMLPSMDYSAIEIVQAPQRPRTR